MFELLFPFVAGVVGYLYGRKYVMAAISFLGYLLVLKYHGTIIDPRMIGDLFIR